MCDIEIETVSIEEACGSTVEIATRTFSSPYSQVGPPTPFHFFFVFCFSYFVG